MLELYEQEKRIVVSFHRRYAELVEGFSQMRWALLTSLAALTVLSALPADAQRDRNRRYRPQPEPAYPGTVPVPSYRDRYPSVYSVPPGYRGTIHWNTPNADGNLGGPGGGGSSGSPGG